LNIYVGEFDPINRTDALLNHFQQYHLHDWCNLLRWQKYYRQQAGFLFTSPPFIIIVMSAADACRLTPAYGSDKAVSNNNRIPVTFVTPTDASSIGTSNSNYSSAKYFDISSAFWWVIAAAYTRRVIAYSRYNSP